MVARSPEDRTKVDQNYDYIALSIEAYGDSSEVNAFSSKYELSFTGKLKLNREEQRGFARQPADLFQPRLMMD